MNLRSWRFVWGSGLAWRSATRSGSGCEPLFDSVPPECNFLGMEGTFVGVEQDPVGLELPEEGPDVPNWVAVRDGECVERRVVATNSPAVVLLRDDL